MHSSCKHGKARASLYLGYHRCNILNINDMLLGASLARMAVIASRDKKAVQKLWDVNYCV